MFVESGLQSSLCLPNVDLPTLAGDFTDNPRLPLHGQWVLHFGECRIGPDLKKTLMLNFSQVLRIFSLTPATYGMVKDGGFSSPSCSSSRDSSIGCICGVVRVTTECIKLAR